DEGVIEFTATKNRIDIKVLEGKESGKTMAFVYNETDASINLHANNQIEKLAQLVEVNGEPKIEVFSSNGTSVLFNANEKSTDYVLQMFENNSYTAHK